MFGNKTLETVNPKKLGLPEFVKLNSPIKHLGRMCITVLLGVEFDH